MEIRVKIDVNPQVVGAICMLAAALGYPGDTIASNLKGIAEDIKAKKTAPTEQVSELVKVWTGQELQKYCLDLATTQKVIKIEDVINTLKKFKDKNGNGIQTVEELVKQKTPEEVNEFVRIIEELRQANIQK